ncbi:hypothetical protein BU16DRAFT_557410 [Lophium mytilinum]|uniref:Uncharacterized protein n=1 Tax=Lophium mytilinum TaxID=390894 RepID=A0A6A6R6F6_9PEZI|nr:hypothetical protein BU16DRAFT_557410 [Lophium mytilinum]
MGPEGISWSPRCHRYHSNLDWRCFRPSKHANYDIYIILMSLGCIVCITTSANRSQYHYSAPSTTYPAHESPNSEDEKIVLASEQKQAILRQLDGAPAYFSKNIPLRVRKPASSIENILAAVKNKHHTYWWDELRITCDTAEKNRAGNGKELGRIDGPKISKAKKQTFHPAHVCLFPELLDAFKLAVSGGVFVAVDAVFQAAGSRTGSLPVARPSLDL